MTRYTGDGGIDAFGSLETSTPLISIPIGVQVKRYRANVQRSDIDRFIGALSGQYQQGIFITTAGYSRQATQKAASSFPRITTVDGEQLVGLMLQHDLGVTTGEQAIRRLDEEYFREFEAQAHPASHQIAERSEIYHLATGQAGEVRPEDDLISMRALSHALRVDTTTVRRWLDQGLLQPDQPGPAATRSGYFFRRDRVAHIRAELLGTTLPAQADQWRQEFLEFAKNRNMTKSYKPVMLKALLALVDRNGEVQIDALTRAFRAFYQARKAAGLVVELGPPDVSDPQVVSDIQLRRLIVRHPLERFLIKGFLEYQPDKGIVRFAPQLWSELRFWELLDIQQSADQQIAYYYNRPR